ncbi:MAG: hypothetical protein ACOCRZ_07605 [Halothermotrichaceae bacterium]
MKGKIINLVLTIILFMTLSGFLFAEDIAMVFGDHENLEKEQKMLWEVYGVNTESIKSIKIATINGTPVEAVNVISEMIKKQGSVLSGGELKEANLGNNIKNTITWAGDRFVEVYGEEWLNKAKKRAEEYKDIKQTIYNTDYIDPNEDIAYTFRIESPHLSPITLELYKGTFIIVTETIGKSEEKKLKEMFGEKIYLDTELPIEYLKGEWTIKERELNNKYDPQVPDVKMNIIDIVASVKETEIEAERFLFSGDIKIGDTVYQAYTGTDPDIMYHYPMSIISILKEEGSEAVFSIILGDLENNYDLFIDADLKEVYENAFAIKIDSMINNESYETDDDEVDYLIRNQ